MSMMRYFAAFFNEQEREDDVADTAGQPNGDEQEQENGGDLPERDVSGEGHEDMKERGPDAEQDVSGV